MLVHLLHKRLPTSNYGLFMRISRYICVSNARVYWIRIHTVWMELNQMATTMAFRLHFFFFFSLSLLFLQHFLLYSLSMFIFNFNCIQFAIFRWIQLQKHIQSIHNSFTKYMTIEQWQITINVIVIVDCGCHWTFQPVYVFCLHLVRLPQHLLTAVAVQNKSKSTNTNTFIWHANA